MKIRNGFVSNSSSSSFICRKKMTLSQAEDKLRMIIDLFESEYEFEKVFAQPYKGSKKYNEELKLWDYLGKEDRNDKFDILNPNRTQVKTTIGRIIIDSADDNSIPYEMFETIEAVFDAIRLHMG